MRRVSRLGRSGAAVANGSGDIAGVVPLPLAWPPPPQSAVGAFSSYSSSFIATAGGGVPLFLFSSSFWGSGGAAALSLEQTLLVFCFLLFLSVAPSIWTSSGFGHIFAAAAVVFHIHHYQDSSLPPFHPPNTHPSETKGHRIYYSNKWCLMRRPSNV